MCLFLVGLKLGVESIAALNVGDVIQVPPGISSSDSKTYEMNGIKAVRMGAGNRVFRKLTYPL